MSYLLGQILLFAQNGGGFGWTILTIWVPIGIVFYLLLIRPQRVEQRKRQAMLDAVKKNDRVVTVGGIYGIVANVQRESDEITLRVDENSNARIRVTLGSIARVISDEPDEAAAN